MSDRRLILGVDGGGSKTAVRIAAVARDGTVSMLGEGHGGPSNVRAVGRAHAEINLDLAVDAAHRASETTGQAVDCAVLGLAGSSLPDIQSFIQSWAAKRELASDVDIVHDAYPVLAAGVAGGAGIALIVGTGSAVVARGSDGQTITAGGWGHWFGDPGSGYDLGRRALAAVAEATDGVGPPTSLVERVLQQLHTSNPREMLMLLGRGGNLSRDIASLAPSVLHAAEDGDETAKEIVAAAAQGPARLVRATVARLGVDANVPLALAGGILCSNAMYRETMLQELRDLGIEPATVTVVHAPVEGCLMLANERLHMADQ